MFLALLLTEIILLVSGKGMISNGSLSITILHIPVILATVGLGLPYGLIIGGVFGIGTMIISAGYKAATIDHLFVNPVLSVLPRLLIALMAWLTYRALKKLVDDHTPSSECIASGGAAFVGTITNTVLVAILVCVLYPGMLGRTTGLSAYAVAFAYIVGANTTIEICLSVIIIGLLIPIYKRKEVEALKTLQYPMRKTFQKWLIIVVSGGFLVTLFCSYALQTMQARKNAETYLKVSLSEIVQEMKSDEENGTAAFLRLGMEGTALFVRNGRIVDAADTELTGLSLEEAGFVDMGDDGEMFLTVLSGSTYFCKAVTVGDMAVIGMVLADEIYSGRNETAIILLLVNFIIFMIIFILVSKLLQDNVVERIYSVNQSLSLIQEGNLDEVIDVRNNEEFSVLSDGINATVHALKETMEQIAVKMNQELEFAREIQQSALPLAEYVAAKQHEYEILGTMDAAKEVGGDFFDYFLIGDSKIGFVIADVSGKGVPAALFMMTSKTLIKNFALGGKSPAEVLEFANDQLCENNEAGMFVTVWLGILDYKTGELQFANAGHNPPLLKKKNQEFAYMDSKTYKRSIMLGMRAGIKYKDNSLVLGRGDVLYLYTDGVTEANNEDKELYGENRLRDLLEDCWNQSAENILKAVRSDIDDFAGNAEQFDDITMIVLKMQSASNTVSMAASYENTGKITEFAEKFLTEEDCAPKLVHQMIIALDEIYSNIVKYSRASDIELTCSVAEDMIYLTFSDNGIPYNPIEANEPDITLPMQERPIGGLGLHMVRKMMDYIDYKHEDDRNVFTIGKKDHSQG